MRELGHDVRNIINVRHKTTKEDLPLFYIDLEPKHNNKDIFKVNKLNYMKVTIEAPYKKVEVLQCKRCQRFGHSKNQCNRPYRCVKCGKDHPTSTCEKTADTEATCVNCREKHPASYRGCMKYKEYKEKILKLNPKHTSRETPIQHPINNELSTTESTKGTNTKKSFKTYAAAVNHVERHSESRLINVDELNNLMDSMFNRFQTIMSNMIDNMMDRMIQLITQMIANLRIVTWNANGLTERRQEFEIFLNTEKIDVALISETRFTDRSYIRIKDYTVYTTNHPSGNSHGGTAVIVKTNLKHYLLEEYRTEKIQATSIKVYTEPVMTLSAVYCPPRHTITAEDFRQYFLNLGNTFVCGGDWNAKNTYWGSRLTLPRGRQLNQTIAALSLRSLSHGEPTYWPTDRNKIPDLVDFYITKNVPETYLSIESCNDLSSDHTPVILNIYCKVLLTEIPLKLHSKHTNWETYQNYITNNVNLKISLKTVEEVENAVEQLTKLIHKALHLSSEATKRQFYTLHQYPRHIKEKVAERRKLRKTWHNTGYPTDKTAFNKASEDLKHLIKKMKDDDLQQFLRDLRPSPDTNYSLWRATRKINRPKNHIPPIRTPDGNWARSNSEKASIFAEHLRTVFQPFSSLNSESDDEVLTYLNSPMQMCMPLKSTSPKEVASEIRGLKEGKSPGYDAVDATMLKHLPKKGILLIVVILNACLRLECFPFQWKIAQVVMILKPGKPPQEASSYRPISLLPVIGKILEKIILNRMRQHLEEILPQHQFGFRANHGTIEQVHRLVDTIGRTLENKEFCSAVFLDIGQAFDKVWHDGLKYKLKKTLPHNFCGIISSYLDGRCFEVRHCGEISQMQEIRSGVPQGSILGPVLYLIFTADLPTNNSTVTATYADDTAIMSVNSDPVTASAKLQSHLTDIEKWFDKWRIKANQAKSTHVTFTLRRQTCPPVALYGMSIPQADDAKYLGMHLDRRLCWQKHIWSKRKQLDTRLRNMYWLIGRKSQLSPTSKITVYKTILKPIWTYGLQLWGTASNSNIEILERFQNKTIRAMLNIPQYISNKFIQMDLNITTVKNEVAAYSRKYQYRLSTHVNELALNLGGTGGVQFTRLKRHSVPNLETRFRVGQ